MSTYSKLFSGWKNFISDDKTKKAKLLTEISYDAINHILDHMNTVEPDEMPFGDLFDDKMRIVIPLPFDPKVLSRDDADSYNNIMQAVKKLGWIVDAESFSKGMAYKTSQSPDFGPALNLKRYGKESPPGPKKKEMKLGRIIQKNKNLDPELKKWWSDNSGLKLVPQYTAVISRYPVDIERMSDFQGIRSCHSEGSDYFKCAIAEVIDGGAIAYAVRTKQLDNWLEGKPIEYFDDQEIFQDPHRGVEGMRGPVSRIRLRRFVTDETELAVPELRHYGSYHPDFMEGINKWVLKTQIHKAMPDLSEEDAEYFSDPRWWESYATELKVIHDRMDFLRGEHGAFQGLRGGWQTDVQEEYNELTSKADDISAEWDAKIKHFRDNLPDHGDYAFTGGSYMDSPGRKMLANFFGLKRFFYDNDDELEFGDRLKDHSYEAGISMRIQEIAAVAFSPMSADVHHSMGDYDEDEFEGANTIERRIEEYNDNFSSLESHAAHGLDYIHAEMQDLEEMGYDIHELAEQDRLFYYCRAHIGFDFDEDEFEGGEEELPDGDWRGISNLADELLDAIDDFEHGGENESVNVYRGDLRFSVDMSNDDYNHGTSHQDAYNFISYLKILDVQYEEMEDAIRERLIELNYMKATPYHDLKSRLRAGQKEHGPSVPWKEDFSLFANFEVDMAEGNLIHIKSKRELGFSPLAAYFIETPEILGTAEGHGERSKSSQNNWSYNLLQGDNEALMKVINKDISAAVDHADKQLSLHGMDISQEKLIKPFTDPGYLHIRLRTRPEQWDSEIEENRKFVAHIYLNANLSKTLDDEVTAATLAIVDYLDENFDAFIENMKEYVGLQIQKGLMYSREYKMNNNPDEVVAESRKRRKKSSKKIKFRLKR